MKNKQAQYLPKREDKKNKFIIHSKIKIKEINHCS